MNDELFTLIDARGHAAGTALHRAAATHSWTAAAPKRPVVWVRPALVLAAVVALVAGLVWVAHKPAEPADSHTPAGLRYVVGDLPGGWKLESTQDQSSTAAQSNGIAAASYGTYDDPTAPYVVIEWADPAHSNGTSLAGTAALNFYSNLREVAAGSAAAVCGTKGSQVFCALDTPNGPMQAQSSHATDAQIGQLLGAVQIVNGEPFVAPASVPAGMSTLEHGGMFSAPFVIWQPSYAGQTVAQYSNASGDRSVTLAIDWASENDMAVAALLGEMSPVDIGGHTGYLGTIIDSSNLHGLVWSDSERTFALWSNDASVDLMALAESVRPATDTEWAASLVVRVPSGGPDGTTLNEGTDGTTPVPGTEPGASGETDPPASVPNGPIVIHDVVIAQTVEPVSANDATYSCELPDGSFGSLQVAVAAGIVFMREPSGQSGSSSFKLSEKVFTTATFMDIGVGMAVVAISTDPAATQLRVTRSNGERYVLDLVPAHGHPEVHLGVVLIPKGELATFDVIDADGKVLTIDPQLG